MPELPFQMAELPFQMPELPFQPLTVYSSIIRMYRTYLYPYIN
jgi:hypothetical protein